VICKSPVRKPDENFFGRTALQDHACTGSASTNSLEEKTAGGNVERDLGGNDGVPRLRVLLQVHCSLFAA